MRIVQIKIGYSKEKMMHIDMGMKVYESVYRSIMEKISDDKHYIIVETNSRRGDSIMRKKGLPKPTGEYAVGTFLRTQSKTTGKKLCVREACEAWRQGFIIRCLGKA